MTNLFDSINYSTTEPVEFTSGDRTAWKRTDLTSYDNSLYNLKYEARLESDGTRKISITATASGTDFVVEIGSNVTATYAAGTYHWAAYIVRISDSQRLTIGSGTFKVKPNLATSTVDPRTHVKKVLDAIEAVIEKRATQSQSNYSINGRQLVHMTHAELLVLRDKYKSEYEGEKQSERIAKGLGGKKILVRFVN